MSERDRILSRLPQEAPTHVPPPHVPNLREVKSSWDQFSARLEVLGGRVVSWRNLAALPNRDWCVEYDVGPIKEKCGSFVPTDPWSATLGVSRASVAVAESGTILINHESSSRRLASLTPPHHVVIVREADIVATLEEAFLKLGPKNAVLITGPSRTADIEGVLVRGVHGPKEIWVVIDQD